ncbi:MAG: transporter related protein, partial [Bacteroidetes bacterium]|nr:transporter related protein [Bacteroidota bacterium]
FMKGICDRLFEFRDGKVKEHICDIEEFMQLRKVERLNELDLDKKEKKLETVAVKQQVAAKQETITADKNKEAEQKVLRSQLKKVEENIERLEKEIKAADEKLSDSKEYEKLMGDQSFFNKYNTWKKDLEKEMEKWEDVSSKLG